MKKKILALLMASTIAMSFYIPVFANEVTSDDELEKIAMEASRPEEASKIFQECEKPTDVDTVLENLDENVYIDYMQRNFEKLLTISNEMNSEDLNEDICEKIADDNEFINDVEVAEVTNSVTDKTCETLTFHLEDGATFVCETIDENDTNNLIGAAITKEYGNRKFTATSTYSPNKAVYPTAKIQVAVGYKLATNHKISGRYVDPANLSSGYTGWRTTTRAYNTAKPYWSANSTKVQAIVKHEVKMYGRSSDGSEFLKKTSHIKQTITVTATSWKKSTVDLKQTCSNAVID